MATHDIAAAIAALLDAANVAVNRQAVEARRGGREALRWAGSTASRRRDGPPDSGRRDEGKRALARMAQ